MTARDHRAAAWVEVRSIGRDMVHEHRMFHETNSMAHHREWRRLRGDLRHALDAWAAFRSLERAA